MKLYAPIQPHFGSSACLSILSIVGTYTARSRAPDADIPTQVIRPVKKVSVVIKETGSAVESDKKEESAAEEIRPEFVIESREPETEVVPGDFSAYKFVLKGSERHHPTNKPLQGAFEQAGDF